MGTGSWLLLAASGGSGRPPPLIQNDAVVLGILMLVLAVIFKTSSSDHPKLKAFYKYVPALLLCYFIPGILGTTNVIGGEHSKLYFAASRYLLPTSLVLLTLSLDLPAIRKLGSKMIIMFLTGTVGIMFGGPLALMLFATVAPDVVGGTGPEAVWRGMSTVAGSWIGGGANQTAMKEVFGVGDDVFSSWIAVDVLVANVWMAFLLYGAGIAKRLDAKNGADTTAIEALKRKVEAYRDAHARVPTTTDLFMILGVGFVVTAVGHFGADTIAPAIAKHAPGLAKFSLTSKFFWLIIIATTLGVLASFTKARELEGAGASRVGSVMLYVLVATIGMNMNLLAVRDRPWIFLVGLVWIAIHAGLMLGVGRLIKAPFFFIAVGSQANIGGAASAPVVASAFHPVLAPVGVMMAVLGYAIGTYAAWLCGLMMQAVAP
ncbi:MAG: DUF819 family protein [Deltaproteobacteria bacterium]|nr:DUF819 family protein [Deltaproteobacteria bacterium]